jgi:hypothetical protein
VGLGDFRVAAEERDGSRVAAEERDGFRVAAEERDGSHVAVVAVQGAPPGADCCASADSQAVQLEGDYPVATADPAEYPGDALAALVLSAEFRADDYSPAEVVVDCSQASPVVALAGDCSRDGCPGIAGVAAPASDQNDCQMGDAGPAAQEHCAFPEGQAGYQEHRAEEHYHSDVQRGSHCRGLPDEERSGCC